MDVLLPAVGRVADDSVPDSAPSGSSSRCAAHRISLVQGGRHSVKVAAATATRHDSASGGLLPGGPRRRVHGSVLLSCVASPQLVSCLAVGPNDGPEGPF